MPLRDYLEKAGNVGMGALEVGNAPFEVIGESIRGAGENEPLRMASAENPSGFRWPSIVQRLAPSTRTSEPPADPLMKAYQGLEGIANLPRGVQAASDVVTGQPDLAAQIGGFGLGLGLMPPVVKGAANVEIPKGLGNERGAITLGKAEPYFPPGSPEREAAFKDWFGQSKVVDEAGKPVTAYRGDFRGDLIKNRFQKGKTTSGRFYFTEDPTVASNYAKGKSYVPDANYENWFQIGTGRSKDNLDNAWYKLSPEQQARVKDTFMRAYKDDATGDVMFGEPDGGIVNPDHWDWALREAKGNWLKAGKETWLNSGALFNDEEQFGKILDQAGIPFRFDDPHLGHPAVTPSHLAIKNPIDAANPPEDFVSAVTKWANRSRKKPAKYGEDAWDKTLRDPKEYAAELQEAVKNHDNLWTTSIPDEVVKIAQKLGYDGIQDMGGKYGGVENKQWIAFEPTQIKSATGNRGTFNPRDPNITHAAPLAVGAGATGMAANAEADQQELAEGGLVEEETDMPFESEAQRGFMYAKHPKIAERFEEETPEDAELPEHVKKMNQGGFAGDWKDDLAGYMDQHFGGEQKSPQHLAGGGFAGDFDLDMGDTSTARGAPYAPPSLPSSPGPVFNPSAGLPPPPPLPPAPETMTPAAPALPPTSRPIGPSGPDPLHGYLAQQREMLNRYGPEEQLALERSLYKQRTGFVPVLASAGAGLADAIMQGVARAGPSNFQSNLENRMDKTQEGQRSALKNAQTGHLAKMKQEMELAQLDPESPISRLAQRSATPLLRGVGLVDDEIHNIPASLIGEAQTRGLSLEEIRTKAEETRALREQNALLMGQGLELRREGAAETARKARAEEAAKAKEARLGAAKDILTKSGNARVLGVPIPWTSDVSAKDKKMALETLREGMQPDQEYEPDVLEYAQTHGITPQAALIQKQRRMRTPTGAR